MVFAQPHVPDDIRAQISELLIHVGVKAQVDKFSEVNVDRFDHVTSKIDTYDPGKLILDINDHTVNERLFVNTFKPEGGWYQ